MKETEEYLQVIDVEYEKDENMANELILLNKIKEDIKFEEQINEEKKVLEGEKDISFERYDREKSKMEKEKRKGFFAKLMSFARKIIGTLLVIPFVVGGAIISFCVVAMGFAVGLGSIVVGVAGLGISAFLITGYPGLIGLLGMFIAMGLLAGGGLVFCIAILLWQQIKSLIKWMYGYKVKYREVE